MCNWGKYWRAIIRRVTRLRFTPIEVFVFHAVSEEYDDSLYLPNDWSSTVDFQKRIIDFQNSYEFISLSKAYQKVSKDWFRKKRYAVLTCDDGFESVLSVLPFLEKHKVPVTLFVNPKYLDGVSKRDNYSSCPRYITQKDLFEIRSDYVTIGMHGFEHNDATKLTKEEFVESVDRCIEVLSEHARYIPYYAYTWGNYSEVTQSVLKEKKIIPVLTDGQSNYLYQSGISRKPIDSYYINRQK